MNTGFSKPIPLHDFTTTNVHLIAKGYLFGQNRPLYPLSISRIPSLPHFQDTQVILIQDRYHLFNNSESPIEIKQVNVDDSLRSIVAQGEILPILLKNHSQAIVLRCLNGDFDWSPAVIPLYHYRQPGRNHNRKQKLIYCKKQLSEERVYFKVVTEVLLDGCVNVIVNDCSWSETSLPVVIDNHSIFPLVVNQNASVASDLWIIEPFDVSPFCWADSDQSQVLGLQFYQPQTAITSLYLPRNKQVYSTSVNCSRSRNRTVFQFSYWMNDHHFHASLSVSVEVLRNVVFVAVKHSSVYSSHLPFKLSENQSSDTLFSGHLSMEVKVAIPQVHATLILPRSQDFLCLTIRGLSIQSQLSSVMDLRLALQELQIDNQLLESRYPVLLQFQKGNGTMQGAAVSLCLQLQKKKTEEFGNCKLLSSINLQLLPLRVCVESNLLMTCLQLYQSWDTVNNPERVDRRHTQLPSTVRSLLSYVKWAIHHSEEGIRSRNPPTPLSAVISKPLSRVQLYEESRHTRVQSLKISPITLSISLALGSQFMSQSYDYFTIQDFKCMLPKINMDERYPRRISYALSQLLSTYCKSMLFSFLFIGLESKTSGNLYRFVSSFYQNVKSLVDNVFTAISTRSLSLVRVVSCVTDYVDAQIVNASLSAIDAAMGLTSWLCMIFQQVNVWAIPHMLHGEITLQSPYIKSKKRYSLFGRLWNQNSTLLWYLIGTVGMVSRPLLTVLSDLQAMRRHLDGEQINKTRAKPPNVVIDGIVMVRFRDWIHFSLLMRFTARGGSCCLVWKKGHTKWKTVFQCIA